MSHLLLTHPPRSNPFGLKLNLNLGPVSSVMLMMALIGLMGLISLTHLNSMSTKGYSINKLEDDYGELVSDSEINDMLILQARSMQTIETDPSVQSMIKPDHVYYVESVTGLAQADY